MQIKMRILSIVLVAWLMSSCSTADDGRAQSPQFSQLVNTSELIEVDADRAILSAHQYNNMTFLAGGSIDRESGIIYRLDGRQITEESTPSGPAIWWIWGDESGELWACGDGGRILRRTTNETWVAERLPIEPNTILYGIWGDNNGVMYAVGGSYRLGGEQNILLSSDGEGTWTRVPITQPPEAFTFFKVWGHNPTWIVGDLGWTARVSPNETTYIQSETGEVLFTVHGNAEEVFAVGGLTTGEIYGLRSGIMIRQQVPKVPALNGLFVRSDGWRLAAGEGGQVLLSSNTSAWESGMLFPVELEGRTIHAVVSRVHTVFAGGDLRRMNRGFIVVAPEFLAAQGNGL